MRQVVSRRKMTILKKYAILYMYLISTKNVFKKVVDKLFLICFNIKVVRNDKLKKYLTCSEKNVLIFLLEI